MARPKNYQWCNCVNCTAGWWIAGSVLVQIIRMEEVSKIMKWRKECQKGFLSIISLLSPCLSSLSRKKFLKMSPPFLVLLYLACTRRVLIFAVSLYEMTVFKRNFSTRPWKQGVFFWPCYDIMKPEKVYHCEAFCIGNATFSSEKKATQKNISKLLVEILL